MSLIEQRNIHILVPIKQVPEHVIFYYPDIQKIYCPTCILYTSVVVQSPSCVWLFVTPGTAARQAYLSLTISQSLPKFMFIALVMLFSHLILWCPLLPFCPQSFQASGSSPMSCQFVSHYQNTGASASASVLPVNIQGWSPLRLTSLISLLSKGFSGVFSSTTVQRHQLIGILPSLQSNYHNRAWPLGRP